MWEDGGMKFGGGLYEVAKLPALFQDEIRTMPMLYRADAEFAVKRIPALRGFIDSALAENYAPFKYESLDVKVAMLKKGWWPCIPGWHLDDFYRPSGGQPDIEHLPEHASTHFMALFGGCSLTEFLDGFQEFPLPPRDGTVYGFYDKLIEDSHSPRITLQSETLYRFTSLDFHRGMPAKEYGWRAFVRLTVGNERPPKNEIRTQVQVYVPADKMFAGW
jgi:hypothetical protein